MRHTPRQFHTSLWAVAVIALVASCVGRIENGEEPATTEGPSSSAGTCGARKVAPSALRRLTHVEYNNTIADLLGDKSAPASTFTDSVAAGFSNDADSLTVSTVLAEGYLAAARNLAATAVKSLDRLLGCSIAMRGERPCVEQFIRSFGKRAYRRPLDADEVEAYLAMFDSARPQGMVNRAVEILVATMLQSPNFLYRTERGEVQLTPFEVATRLSYLFLRSMPDPELFAAAESGELADAAQIAHQARRLLRSPRARETLLAFQSEWLGLEELSGVQKTTRVYPEFSLVARYMKAETSAFLGTVLDRHQGRLDTLLTGAETFINEPLATKIYGLPGVTGLAMREVSLDPGRYAGVLTQPSLLSIHALPEQSDPIRRGKFVREQLLCQTLPPPPADAQIADLPPPSLRASTRQRFEQHRSDPVCSGCHRLMDPIGFAFESFDGIGRHRTHDGGGPIDDAAEMHGSRDMDGTFRGVPELARRLAGSQEVQECVVRQGFRFAFGRTETPDDDCALKTAFQAFVSGGLTLTELMVAFTQTDTFAYRR